MQVLPNGEKWKSRRLENLLQLYEKLLFETPVNEMAFVEISSNSGMLCSVYLWHHDCFSKREKTNSGFLSTDSSVKKPSLKDAI